MVHEKEFSPLPDHPLPEQYRLRDGVKEALYAPLPPLVDTLAEVPPRAPEPRHPEPVH